MNRINEKYNTAWCMKLAMLQHAFEALQNSLYPMLDRPKYQQRLQTLPVYKCIAR